MRHVVAVALLVCAGWAAVHGAGGESRPLEPALTANNCILCDSFGANQVPQICNSCDNKH